MEYDVFVSYSHAADDLLSERVQDGLQRFAKPWWRRRELSVFHDRSALTADPGLWSSIVEAMESSRYFLLLAAPEAAASAWVNREVNHWRELHGGDRLLILQTDGEITWSDAAGDFDRAATTALPAALFGCFPEEPRHVDMRWARREEQLDITDGRFADQIAELSAAIHGMRKDEIAGEHVRQHRRTVRTVIAAAAALAFLTVASVAGAVLAVRSASESRDNARRALAAQQRAISEQQRANSAADLARRRGDEVTHANAQLASANQSLESSNQQLETTNDELVNQTNQTEQQREQALANAAQATRNAAEAQRNADAASANAAEAASNAAEAERNAAEAARERNAAIANRNEANRQRDRAIANERKVEERNKQLAAANAAGLSRQLAAQSITNVDNLDEALLLWAQRREQ